MVTLEELKSERDRVRDLKEQLWSDYNQAVGAWRQLEAIIAAWEKKQPAE